MKNIYLETEYIVTITKSSNEELNIQDKDGKKYANAYRTYKISGIPKTFSAEGKEIVMDVLNNPGWVASVYNTDGDLSIESDLNQQIIKDMINETKNELNKIKDISDAMETLMEQSEKHDLFLPDLTEKFNELSTLIKEIIPENLLENLKDAQNSLEEMDLQSLQKALENMSNNISEIESELDRYIDIFKRLQAEQKMDELKNRLEKLVNQKDKLDRDIENLKLSDDKSTESRIWQEELRGLEELNNINQDIDTASELIKPFSKKSSESLEKLKDNSDFKLANNNINKTKTILLIIY